MKESCGDGTGKHLDWGGGSYTYDKIAYSYTRKHTHTCANECICDWRNLNELYILCQCQFPGFGHVI